MKILIASKFFYMRGGAELVAICTRSLLQQHGHQVRVLAMDYPDNIPLAESAAFPAQVKLFGSLTEKMSGVRRMFGLGDVKRSVRAALDEFAPDVVHLHNVHTYLSPLIATEAKKRGIRVVWTLHDYKLFCPSYSCRRPDGTICDRCIEHGSSVLKYRCMKGSMMQSLMGYAESLRWSRRRIERSVDAYIAPSAFMGAQMRKAGYAPEKIKVLCNFADPEKIAVLKSVAATQTDTATEPYMCYIGRLSYEKGVETMIKAAIKAGVRLKVAGGGPLLEELKQKYADTDNIEFLGHQDAKAVAHLLQGATASVLPSEWYENNPLGVIESLSAGTPVIGAEIGGIPELIEAPSDGYVYESGNVEALAECMRMADNAHFDRAEIARRAAERFGAEAHYRQLMAIYEGR